MTENLLNMLKFIKIHPTFLDLGISHLSVIITKYMTKTACKEVYLPQSCGD